MNAPVSLNRGLTPAEELEVEGARIGGALRRIYQAGGYRAAVDTAQHELQALAEQVRQAGGDLEGFVG